MSARPRSASSSPGGSGRRSCGCSATRGSTPHQAIYEWDYQRQLLYLRAHDRGPGTPAVAEDELFSERFLIRRPLLQAIAASEGPGQSPPVLLIDEIDRADDEFEAFLLEILADFTITVPEVGTFRAEVPPVVILTSNRTRDVHDALKRRAFYHWIEHPDFDREVEIVLSRVPEAGEQLARQVTAAVQSLRSMGLYKSPGVAEAIDWARALHALGRDAARRDEREPHARCGLEVSGGRRTGPGRDRGPRRGGGRPWLRRTITRRRRVRSSSSAGPCAAPA